MKRHRGNAYAGVSLVERLEQRQLLASGASIKFSRASFEFTDVPSNAPGGAGPSAVQYIAIRNGGTEPLVLSKGALSIAGTHAANFAWGFKTVPATIQPGESRTFSLQFEATAIGLRTAEFIVKSNDPKFPVVSIPLRGQGVAGPSIKFSRDKFLFYDIASGHSGGSGPSRVQYIALRNGGTTPLELKKGALSISGEHAGDFRWGFKTVPATIQPGDTRTFSIEFEAKGLGPRFADLVVKSNDPKNPTVKIPLRGMGAAGAGGDLEPSLQHVLDLHEIPVKVGDSNPSTTKFSVPPSTPNDEVDMQRMVKAGAGNVSIQLLGVFVNKREPATTVGYYPLGDPDNGVDLFKVYRAEDSQSVQPKISGPSSFDPGSSSFGIYTVFPAFSDRKATSEDALNTWETKSSNHRKVRFYPLKNKDGSTVPNAYVFATEDWNVDYDFQDVVGIIRNVKQAPSSPQIGLQSLDGVPGVDRLVFNKIENLDVVRPNVFHETSTLKIVNSGNQTLTVSSLKLSDSTKFKILSGGGSNIKISPGASRDVTLQFYGTGSNLVSLHNATLTVESDDPENPSKVVNLAAIWQKYSEKDPSGKYGEPTLQQIVQTFGYTTVITNTGEKLNTGSGKPIKVGDEVLSHYWTLADPNGTVGVRMIGAFHRQYNTDPITGEILTAASSVRWYYKGKSATTTKIFVHNINEGQALLPHLENSTTKWASGSAKPNPNTVFGFKVDGRFSDPALNPLDFDKNGVDIPGTGHAFRFYPLKDGKGKLIPNTYIMAQDYTSGIYANYDYQDNIYIVSNIKPASQAASALSSTVLFSSQDIKETESEHEVLS